MSKADSLHSAGLTVSLFQCVWRVESRIVYLKIAYWLVLLRAPDSVHPCILYAFEARRDASEHLAG